MSNIPNFECQPDWFFLQAQQQCDQAFLHHWERHGASFNPVNSTQNSEAKDQYLLARKLQSKLETLPNDSEASLQEIRALKEKIDGIYNSLSPEAVSAMNFKFGKRKRKRRYQQRLKAKWREFESHKLMEREALGAQIDAEREGIREEILRGEQEKERQRRTELVLNEVKKQKGDVMRLEKTLNSLQTLRNLRKKRLLPPDPALTQRTESSMDSLKRLLLKRKEMYDEKEASLRAEIHLNEATNLHQPQSALDSEMKALQEALFGPEYQTCAFPEFYFAAENRLDDLIRIRAEWDQFLVNPRDPNPLASAIPLKWVPPPLSPFECETS